MEFRSEVRVCALKRFDKNYKIISNKEVCADYFELRIEIGDVSKSCSPGQFFMIGVPGVFLRRPFSIHDVKKDTISFLYRVVGKGTKLLSEIKSEMLPLLGPLGKGYDLTPDSKGSIGAGKKICFNPIIVAGGTGIASVYFLAAKLKKKGVLYYGVRTKKDLLCLDKFKKIDWKIVVSTDDGSKGYKGYITDLISKNLKNSDMLFACGPIPMLKKVLHVAKEKNIKGFISLEEKMACGIGNCQGCAVKIKGEYKMVCKDGPVFKIEELEL